MTTTTAHRPLTRGVARMGLVARGAMFFLLGIVVARLAWPGPSPRAADGQGALRTLAAQPAGRTLLAVLALGFAAYAGWQWLCAWQGDKTFERVAAALRGLLWFGFAVTAARMVMHAGGSSNTEESLTARLLNAPFGRWIVAVAGAAVILGAAAMLRKVREREFLGGLRPLSGRTRTTVKVAARVGITARSVVYGLAGAFLIRAAVTHTPGRGVGLDGALSQVAKEPYGTWLLCSAAFGFLAYAVWCGLRARYEDVERSDG
jgi:hypothetical protein